MESSWEASFAADIHRIAVDKYHHVFKGLRAGEYCRAQGEDVFERGRHHREPCVQLELLREQYARIGQAYQIQRGSYIRKDLRTWQRYFAEGYCQSTISRSAKRVGTGWRQPDEVPHPDMGAAKKPFGCVDVCMLRSLME
jgi:hypothetical protein